MHSAFASCIRIMTWVARLGAGLAFAVIIVAVTLQILGRTGLVPATIWSEELTRYALLWLIAFGAGLGLRSGDLVNVDLVCEALPRPMPWALRLLAAALTAGFCAVLIQPALLFTQIGARQTSPALGLSMDLIHITALITLALLGLFAALRVLGMLIGAETGLAHKSEEI